MSINRPQILDELIQHHSENNPDKIAIRYKTQSISYGTLYDDIDKATQMMLGLGIRHSDRVGMMFPNRPEMLFLYFACFRIGAIAVPINTRYQRQEIEYALEHSECMLLIIDKAFSEITMNIDHSVTSLQRIIVHVDELEQHADSLHHHLSNAPANQELPTVHPDDPAVIFYTSGSTARPKGVTHTHFSLLGNARIQYITKEITPETTLLASTGVGYIAGLSGIALPAFLAGATLILEPDLEADKLIKAIEHYQVHTTLMLPTKLLEILGSPLSEKSDFSSLKNCFVAGDKCSPDLYQRFKKRMGFDLLQAFGMTECEGFLANRPSGPKRNGTIGKPSEGVAVRLVDSDGNDVAYGEAGEIIVKSDSVMRGYWEDPEHTAETLRDGWLYGGDVASCDNDGFYTFLERKREIIIHGGSNVGPHEVEDIIDSYPDVKESCVVGIADAHYGAILEAYIVWERGAKQPDTANLKAWVAKHLATYKVPDRWKVMDQIPKTATGKLDRKLLHQKANEEALSANSR
ncbi:MAG: class I adenylate-forming enzyme family protein [Campylobacterota bacterium]|nr:class I adenylate-forming enzyme family protein [Campylobacterota bacterium]